MNPIAEFVKENRKAAGLTQEQFALRSGLGLRFVRELEQGKETVRMDKVNVALAMFNAQAVAGKKENKCQYSSRVGIDMTEFYIRLVFCFIVGNSDMHLKNFSLLETAESS